MFLCSSRSFSFLIKSISTFPPSLTRKPPFELTIFDKSYSKYVPSRESRFNGLEDDAAEVDGGSCPGRVRARDRLLFELIVDEEDDASDSR